SWSPRRAVRLAHACASCAAWRWCRSARRSSRASWSWSPAAARCPCEAARSTHPGVYDRGRATARTPLAAPRKVSTPMAQLTLIIGSKNYSSWLRRAWRLLQHAGVEFEEILIQLDTPTTHYEIDVYGPRG